MPRARIASGFGCGRKPNLFRQMMIALRSDHDVYGRGAVDDLGAFCLRDAAGDRDLHLAACPCGLVLGDAEPSEFGINLFGCLLADVTGVEDHEVGVLSTRGLDKAFAGQRVHHALRIVDIHLAAIGLDEQLARRRHGTLNTIRKRRHPRAGAEI